MKIIEGQDETFCSSITTNDTSLYKCALRSNKCIAIFLGCESYNGKNKQICESIILDNIYKKCIFDNKQNCITTNKLCSEYLGNDENECIIKYYGSNGYHSCKFVNNKCYDPYKYKFCSDYKGINREECDLIQPQKSNGEGIDLYSKCVFNQNEGCMKKENECSQAKSEDDCEKIYLLNSNKNCAFMENKCI